MLILLLEGVFLKHVLAESIPARFDSEAQKAHRIRAILAKYPLKFQPDNSSGSVSFCGAFYRAMGRGDKGITYIEPVVKTDDMNHPGLERYRSCENYPGPGEGVYPGDLGVIGDRAFRLYRLDAARKFKHGLEEIIYGEQEFIVYPEEPFPVPKRGSLARFTGYQQVSFSSCTLYQTLGVTPSTWFVHGLQETLNAIVRYRHRYYVLAVDRYVDLEGTQGIPISLYAYRPSTDEIAYYPLTCEWKYSSATDSGDTR